MGRRVTKDIHAFLHLTVPSGLRSSQSLLRVIKLYDHKIPDHKRSTTAPSSRKGARSLIEQSSRKLFFYRNVEAFCKIIKRLLRRTYCLGEDVSCYLGEGVACFLRYRIDFLHDFITKFHFDTPGELAGIEAG